MTTQTLSPVDIKILTALQQDGRITNQTLADQIGMSASPCWRRVKQLEEHRYIQSYKAVLDRRKIGLGVMVFIRVSIDRHSEAEARKFEQEVMQLEDVVACYSIGGDADFFASGRGTRSGFVRRFCDDGGQTITRHQGNAEHVRLERNKAFRFIPGKTASAVMAGFLQ